MKGLLFGKFEHGFIYDSSAFCCENPKLSAMTGMACNLLPVLAGDCNFHVN